MSSNTSVGTWPSGARARTTRRVRRARSATRATTTRATKTTKISLAKNRIRAATTTTTTTTTETKVMTWNIRSTTRTKCAVTPRMRATPRPRRTIEPKSVAASTPNDRPLKRKRPPPRIPAEVIPNPTTTPSPCKSRGRRRDDVDIEIRTNFVRPPRRLQRANFTSRRRARAAHAAQTQSRRDGRETIIGARARRAIRADRRAVRVARRRNGRIRD